jgi:NADH:ubiquinone oxidoreductase subunit 3 (subunit A)
MANRTLPLQIFEGLLVIGLLAGLLSFRDPDVPRIALLGGLAVNLLLQAAVITALRKQKRVEQLQAAERDRVANRQHAMLRVMFIGCSFLFVALVVDVGLFVSHTYSARTFAFVALVAAASTFIFLTFRFARLQRSQG